MVRASGIRIPLWVVFVTMLASAQAEQPTIATAEPVNLSPESNAAQFDAFGRHFSLTLADNARVLQKLSPERQQALKSYRLIRGTIDGETGSWVRLTQTSSGIEGAIWDGHELYAVTSHAKIAPYLSKALNAQPSQTVMYRLSDMRDALPADFCALSDQVQPEKTTALDQYQSIVQELQNQAGGSDMRQLEISLIGDTDLQASETDATGAMLARLNIVEGIYSSQLDLLIMATDMRLMPVGSDPFTSTRGATLLEQLGAYRAATPEVRARGLAHLVTGKDLDGSTAGIAYVKTVCSVDRGVSVSERSFGTTISALIMAHEIGHNLGADHDGEAGSVCESVGGGYIMAPSVSGFATFSQCSINTMKPVIEAANCIKPAEYADASLSSQANNVTGESGLPYTLPFTVTSKGNLDAEDVVVTVTLPATTGFSIDSASASQGTCSVAGLTVACSLGTLPSGDEQMLNVIARSTAAANFTVSAHVEASNDRMTSNNNRSLSVSLRTGVDAAVALSVSSANAALGAPIELNADVSSLRSQALHNATLSLNLNQPVTSATLTGGNCTVNASSVNCTLADIPGGASRRLNVQANTAVAGPLFASATVSVSGDGDLSNNSASVSGWVQPPRDVSVTTDVSTIELNVGAPYEIAYTVRSRGSTASGEVTLSFSIPSLAVAVDSFDDGGAVCTQTGPDNFRCDLGSLDVGATRVIKMRVRGTRAATADMVATVESEGDGYDANDFARIQLRIAHAVDLSVGIASGGTGVEDSPIDGQFSLRSNGRQPTVNGTLDIDLNAAGTLLSATIHNGAACTLITPQKARCALPTMASGTRLFFDYRAQFAEPGTYDVNFTAKAALDTAPENDTLTRAMLVRPYNDIAVTGGLDAAALLVGETREQVFTVTTDRRSLGSAQFVAGHYLPGLEVAAIRASAGDCRVDDELGGVCDFTDLPAFARVTVTVTYRALEGSDLCSVAALVNTAGDVASSNDAVRGEIQVQAITDVELRVGAGSIGEKNVTVSFPPISVVNGAATAFGTRLEVTLPAQVSLVSMSASNAICSGTQVLRCDFSDLPANTTSTVNISVRPTASGNFTSALRLTTSNDTNAANDSGDVTFDITSAVEAPADPPSGKGGGGRIELWMLAVMALLAMRRSTVAVHIRRRAASIKLSTR
jgi:hypothetical protein